MRINFLLSFVLFTKILFAQNTEEREVYLDSVFKETAEIDSPYYRVIENEDEVKEEYKFKIFYKSGKVFKEGNTRSKTNLIEEGLITSYFENGNKKEELTILKGTTTGTKTMWFENGKTKYIKDYLLKQKNSLLPTIKIMQFWDKNNIQKIIDGNGFFEDEEKKCYEKGMIENGLKTGKWIGEDKSNSFEITFIEEYKNGELIKGVSTDKANIEHTYYEVNAAPKPRKGYEHFYKYIGKKFAVNKQMEATGGKVLLSFTVEKDGSINEATVLKSAGADFDNESIRVVKQYPDWESGKYRGLKARVKYVLPITIRPPQ